MPRVLTRSPIKMPGTRQCRLARRLAAGLSPAEIRRLDTATEEDIEAFVSDRDLSRLVDQYAAVRDLPSARAAGPPVRDGLAGALEPHRRRRPARDALRRLPGEPGPASGKAPRQARGRALRAACASPTSAATRLRPPAPRPRRCRATASIRWARRRRPSTASSTSSPRRPARLFLSGPSSSRQRPRLPSRSRSRQPKKFPPAMLAIPPPPDSFSPLAAMARANPALADWIIARIEKRLAELGRAARARRPEKDRGPQAPRPLSDKRRKKPSDLPSGPLPGGASACPGGWRRGIGGSLGLSGGNPASDVASNSNAAMRVGLAPLAPAARLSARSEISTGAALWARLACGTG